MPLSRLAICFCSILATASAAERPNVLFFILDDLRVQLGCYGDASVKSPNIDRLAAAGVRFDRAYCQYSICGPSRASLLTGLRPDALKIDNIDTYFRNTVPDVVTLPQYFKANGYETAYLGKFFHPGQTDDADSWSRRLTLPGARPGDSGTNEGTVYRLPSSLEIVRQRRAAAVAKFGPRAQLQGMNGGPFEEAADLPDSDYPDGRIADGAIAALRQLKGHPFFFGVGFHRPHLPFVAPKKYFDRYDPAALPLAPAPNPPVNGPQIARQGAYELRTFAGIPTVGRIDDAHAREILRAYDACVSFSDAQVGRVLAELDALGLRQNTIIVLLGDNGWHLGDLTMWGKATDYEVATRVPLIICDPRLHTAGKTVRGLVEFVDIYPTLCELAGLPVPRSLAGESLATLLREPAGPGKDAVFSQIPSPAIREWAARPLSAAMETLFAPDLAQRDANLRRELGARYDPERLAYDVVGYTMRTDRFRCTLWLDRRDPKGEAYGAELYDHASDPNESVNVAADPRYAAETAALGRRIREQAASATPSDRIVIDPARRRQRIDGFGASAGRGANDLKNRLSAVDQTRVLDFLFGPSGMRLSLLRLQLGFGDEGAQPWLAHEAIRRGVSRFFALPWSPPAGMKANGRLVGGTLKPGMEPALAEALERYVLKSGNEEGIPIQWLGLQNEPNVTQVKWACCGYPAGTSYNTLAEQALARFAADGLAATVVGPEGGNTAAALAYLKAMPAELRQKFGVLTTHDYAPYQPGLFAYGQPVWMTEHCFGKKPDDASIADGVRWAGRIHDWMQRGASSYLFWYAAIPGDKEQALVMLRPAAAGLAAVIPKRAYTFAQYSRFVRPGFERLEASISSSALKADAFVDPATGGEVVVVVNDGTQPRAATIYGLAALKVRRYRTSATEDLAHLPDLPVAATCNVGLSFPPQSVTTLIEDVPPPSTPPAPVTTLTAGPCPLGIRLTWQATGASGNLGEAARAEIRYSTEPITAENFKSATPLASQPPALAPGTSQGFVATGLPKIRLYFGLETQTESGRHSSLSNVASLAAR